MRFSLGPRFSTKKDITPGPGAIPLLQDAGVSTVLEGAVEMVVVGGDFELPLHSVRAGCVFRIG
jgi:hypothetical protein